MFSLVSLGSTCAFISFVPLIECVVKVTFTQPYGYDLAFTLLAALSGVGFCLALVLKTKYDWKASTFLN